MFSLIDSVSVEANVYLHCELIIKDDHESNSFFRLSKVLVDSDYLVLVQAFNVFIGFF